MNIYDGKQVLITGGSSGIGLALAKNLASKGANIWILARRPDQLEVACQQIEQARLRSTQQVGTIIADIANRDQVQTALGDHLQKNGTPDYLFNSAGITMPGLFEDQSLDVFDSMIEVNYLGTVNVIKTVLPGMITRGSGYIVMLCSGAGLFGLVGYSAYGASKFAMRGLADVMRVELKPKGIKISVVAPGDTQTPQLEFEDQYKPEVTRALVGTNSKIQTAEHVADVVVRDVARGRYMITPGFDVTLFYNLANTFGIVYPIMDFLVGQAWKQVNGSNHNGHK